MSPLRAARVAERVSGDNNSIHQIAALFNEVDRVGRQCYIHEQRPFIRQLCLGATVTASGEVL